MIPILTGWGFLQCASKFLVAFSVKPAWGAIYLHAFGTIDAFFGLFRQHPKAKASKSPRGDIEK